VLNDPDSAATPASIGSLAFTPPKNCEVILDQRTKEILEKVKQFTESKKDLCIRNYSILRAESPRPFPLDLWGRQDSPEFSVFRSTFGSWIGVRRAAGDAEKWEFELTEDNVLFRFLMVLERDWQQSRVYSYALVWALCAFPNEEDSIAYDRFFDRFPRWKVEYKSLSETKAWNTLNKEIDKFLDGKSLSSEISNFLPEGKLLQEVEGRIRLTLEKDFKLRHGGILRGPEDLVLHRRYDRPEIVNHYGVQYDPARHNFGVIQFSKSIVIISKLDTSSAMQKHHYINRFLDEHIFSWQSQNQQRQDNKVGRMILDHEILGFTIYLFVQRRSHEKAFFCGEVSVKSVEGDAPMNVEFRLTHPLSPDASHELIASVHSGNSTSFLLHGS
jgi:hypothetical protein